MAKSRRMSESMRRASDPRHAIFGAYSDMEKYGAQHLVPEFEEKINNLDNPSRAFSLAGQYSRMAKAHFDAGQEGTSNSVPDRANDPRRKM